MKRCFDLILSLAALLIALPLLIVVGLLVWWKMGIPVIFRQERAGQHGKPFFIVKFRTMNNKADRKGQLLPDAERLTQFGKFLRNTSLDELPELWNVVKGQMSLVGPRPLPMDYLQYYSPRQARRHEVRPGITGWAQVNGRNSLSWERKFELDIWYVENYNFILDLKIILLTIVKTLKRSDINAENHATMYAFRGTDVGSRSLDGSD